jgi:hypothetical protein
VGIAQSRLHSRLAMAYLGSITLIVPFATRSLQSHSSKARMLKKGRFQSISAKG